MNNTTAWSGVQYNWKYPRADEFLNALYALPDDLLPEFWYPLEPNPKKNRIYLREDKERFISENLELGMFGSYKHNNFTILTDQFAPSDGWPDDDMRSTSFSVLSHKSNAAKTYDITDLIRVFEHFTVHLDIHSAFFFTGESRSVFQMPRVNQALAWLEPNTTHQKRDHIKAGLENSFFGVGSDYAAAKCVFPSLAWRTVISEEMADDYALDMDALRDIAVKVRDIKAPGTAGNLTDLQFSEHPDDWQGYTDKLLPHVLAADRHRCMIKFYDEELVPKGWHGVQAWDKWLYQGEFAWPKK